MSFILDALKKLEREKQAREPGVVVVGPVPWGGGDRRGGRRWLVLSGVAVAALVGGTAWWLAPASTHRPEASPVSASGPPAQAGQEPRAPAVPPPSTGRPEAAAAPRTPALRERGLPDNQSSTPRAEGPEAAFSEGSSVPLVDPEVVIQEVPAAQPVADDPVDVEFRLSAISTRDGKPVALLNDRLVREGDAFEGVRILRIGTTEIEIEVDGKRRTIGF